MKKFIYIIIGLIVGMFGVGQVMAAQPVFTTPQMISTGATNSQAVPFVVTSGGISHLNTDSGFTWNYNHLNIVPGTLGDCIGTPNSMCFGESGVGVMEMIMYNGDGYADTLQAGDGYLQPVNTSVSINGYGNPNSSLSVHAHSGQTSDVFQSFKTGDDANPAFNVAANGNVGVATNTPGTLFSIGNTANFTTATSSFYSTGGVNLTAGCYAVNNSCITGSATAATGQVLVVHTDGTQTLYNPSSNTDFARGTALLTAVNAAVDQDSVFICNAVYDVGSAQSNFLDLSKSSGTGSVDLHGCSEQNTIIKGYPLQATGALISLGASSTVTDLEAWNYGTTSIRVPLGRTDAMFDLTGFVIRNVKTQSISDGFYFVRDNLQQASGIIDNFDCTSNWDCFVINAFGGHTRLYDSRAVITASTTISTSNTAMIISGNQTIDIYGYDANVQATTTSRGIVCSQSGSPPSTINFYNGHIQTSTSRLGSGATVFDLFQSGSNCILNVSSNVQYNTASTSGTITYTDSNPIIKSIGAGTINVGIATTSPWAQLSVNGTAGGTIPVFVVATSTSGFATSTAFIVDQNGNIGVGSTSPYNRVSISNTAKTKSTLSVSGTGNGGTITVCPIEWVAQSTGNRLGCLSDLTNGGKDGAFYIISDSSFQTEMANFFVMDRVVTGDSRAAGFKVSDEVGTSNASGYREDLMTRASGGGSFVVGLGLTPVGTIIGPNVDGVVPASPLSIGGGTAIGSTYYNTNAAPTNGLIVQGIVGIGTTTPYATLSVQSGSNTGDAFAVATSTGNAIFGIDNDGHRFTSGWTPTITGGATTGTIVGDDEGGTITTGTTISSVTLNFAKAYRNTPYCKISDDSTASAADVASISTTAVTFGLSVGLTGGHLYYECAYHK